MLAGLWVGFLSFPRSAVAENWPDWRGPRGDGTSLDKNVPKQWDIANAVWKTTVPGVGHASPIVWGDRVFTVTAMPEKLDRMILCFDRATGKILWQQIVAHGPLEKINPQNSYASGTPATDGKRVYVTFRVGDDIVVAAHDLVDGRRTVVERRPDVSRATPILVHARYKAQEHVIPAVADCWRRVRNSNR